MKIGIGLLVALAAVATSAHAVIGTVLQFEEYTASGPNEIEQISLENVWSLPDATFGPLGLTPAKQTTFNLTSASGDPFATVNSSKGYTLSQAYFPGCFHCSSAQPVMLIAEIFVASAPPGSTLYVGVDSLGNGQPRREDTLCQIQLYPTDTVARCMVDLSLPNVQGDRIGHYWVLVQAPAGPVGAQYSLTLSEAILYAGTPTYPNAPIYQQLLVTGPGHASPGTTLPIRIARPDPLPAAADNAVDVTRFYGAVTIDPNDLYAGQGTTAILPFAMTRGSGNNNVQRPLSFVAANPAALADTSIQSAHPALSGRYSMRTTESQSRAFFDVPPTTDGSSYAPLALSIAVTPFSSARTTDVYLMRADFPAASASPLIAAAPVADATAVVWDHVSPSITFTPRPGRWYVVAKNNSSNYVQLDLATTSATGTPQTRLGAGANPTLAAGAYYNTQRPGHGIFISQASGQQALDWYTYLEDGTPTFYQAQAAAPDPKSGWWSAPVNRVAWNGSKGEATQVGTVSLTPIATNQAILTWTIEGQAGSEVFDLLAASGDCPSVNGAATNFSGAWYAPSQPGYGMDVVALPSLQSNVFYFYDNVGLARWGLGNTSPFALSSTVSLTQSKGFCPTCAYAAVTTQPLGTLNVDYSDASKGNYSTHLTLQPPLTGTWTIDKPMERLTGSAVCTP